MSTIDHAFRAAVAAEVSPLVDEVRAMRQELAQLRASARATAPAEDALRPLSTVLQISARAARGRLDRDPELRAIGVRVGSRLRFRTSDVRAFYAMRATEKGER